MNPTAIDLRDVCHRYVAYWALYHLQLKVDRGESIAVLGPNGCGKSTLLKILATLLESTSGGGAVLGFDFKREKRQIRKHVSWLGHDLGLYKTLTAEENLRFSFGIRGQKPEPQKINEVLTEVGLEKVSKKFVGSFSIGMRKRLSLARILLENPSLVLLDEPHTNLDREGKFLMNRYVAQWKKIGTTVLLASHDHHEALPQCDKALILNQGRLVYFGEAKKIPENIIL